MISNERKLRNLRGDGRDRGDRGDRGHRGHMGHRGKRGDRGHRGLGAGRAAWADNNNISLSISFAILWTQFQQVLKSIADITSAISKERFAIISVQTGEITN